MCSTQTTVKTIVYDRDGKIVDVINGERNIISAQKYNSKLPIRCEVVEENIVQTYTIEKK